LAYRSRLTTAAKGGYLINAEGGDEKVPASILTRGALDKWSAGFVAAVILISILIPILEYQVGITSLWSVTRIILATALAIAGIGSLITGIIVVRGKRLVFFMPLVLGVSALI
jgi:hypothetical protein